MTESEAIEKLEANLECQKKQVYGRCEDCNIDKCDDCELCYKQGNNGERIESTKIAIQALEKQIPKKPYKDNENGIYEKEYCPICHRSLFPNDHHCICGQAIDWMDEE